MNQIGTLVSLMTLIFSIPLQASDLEKEMKNIGNNSKALKVSLADPSKKTEALHALGEIIKSAENAKILTPKKAQEITEANRAQFIAAYQKQIGLLIEQFKAIETEVTMGKTQDALADFAKIGQIKREGHEKFAPKE